MKEMQLFQNCVSEPVARFKQFVDNNPIGSLVLDDGFRVVSINDNLCSYFEYDFDEKKDFFGNIFKCQYIADSSENCGTRKQCANCKIRNSVKNAFELGRAIQNLKINKWFMIKGKKTIKWFDISIVPINLDERRYIWVSFVDLTEFMKYKIEFELNQVLSEEESILEKEKFHRSTVQFICENYKVLDELHLLLVELTNTGSLLENFGQIWRRDYFASFQHYLGDLVDGEDEFCRYSQNQFLVFLPYMDEGRLDNLLDQLHEYQYKQFHMIDSVACRCLRLKKGPEHTDKEAFEYRIHKEYFSALSKLEKARVNEIYEVIL